MSITAITVTHNSAGVIATALACVYSHPRVSRCIVVDNASADATLDIVQRQFPSTDILRNEANQGFGVACNRALEQVTSEFALLLNPDAVIDAEGINRLLDCLLSRPDAAIAAPVLAGDKDDLSTWPFRPPVIRGKKPLKIESSANVFKVPFISGAIALWRMELMRRVGFFDPAFFLFYEDDDLSLRVSRAGYAMLLVSGLNARHEPGRSCVLTGELESLKRRSSVWSYLYIHRKYRGRLAAWLMAATAIIRESCVVWKYRRAQLDESDARDIVVGQDKAWAMTVDMHEREHAAAWQRVEEERIAALQKFDEERLAAEHKLRDQEATALAGFAAEGAALKKEAEERLATFSVRYKERQKTLAQSHAGQQDEAARQHEEAWVAVLRQKGETPAARAKHEAQWAQAAAAFEKEWQEATRSLEEEWASAMCDHDRWWKEKERSLEERRAAVAKEHEGRWAALACHYEAHRAQVQTQCDQRLAQEAQAIEERQARAAAAHEEKRKILAQELDGAGQIVRKRGKSVARLRAALSFLRHPRRFDPHD